MPNTIIIKKSSTASAVPAPSSLQPGELAVNLADAKLYSKTTGGSVIVVGSAATGKVTASTAATATTITPNIDTYDAYDLTALATALTVANPTGTPYNMQRLIVRVRDNGTARALSFGTAYASGGVALPTTTAASKSLMLGFFYDAGVAEWLLIALTQEP